MRPREEAIKQLKHLRIYCLDASVDSDDDWLKDVEALDVAIKSIYKLSELEKAIETVYGLKNMGDLLEFAKIGFRSKGGE